MLAPGDALWRANSLPLLRPLPARRYSNVPARMKGDLLKGLVQHSYSYVQTRDQRHAPSLPLRSACGYLVTHTCPRRGDLGSTLIHPADDVGGCKYRKRIREGVKKKL